MADLAARAARFGVAAILLLLLLACAGRPPAPIEDHTRGTTPRSEGYTVLRGDTLYSIAFRYGLDFRRLASANGIAAPYTIYPGQALKLAEAPLPVRSSASTSKAAPAQKSKPNSSPPPPAKPVVKAAPKTPTKASSSTTTGVPSKKASGWQWPVAGRVSRRFDDRLHKGIDITGERGTSIVATAAGKVVYAGTGIAGYGLMLILRHDDVYLSAYGHTDEILVTEGDAVRAGQLIARRGSSGTDAVKLHFEIRRRGRPVDPLTLLPAR